MSQSHNSVSLMRHLYQLIATKERSQHDSFMPHKYFSRQSGYSLFMGTKDPEMKAPLPPDHLPFVNEEKSWRGI